MTDEQEKTPDAEPGEENFAEMLEQSMVKRGRLEPGQAMETKIVSISDEWVFLDLGGKGEGYLDRKELADEEGNLKAGVGDTVKVYFVSSENNELLFTTRFGAGAAGRSQLEDAWKGGIPVEGTVVKEVKGGYEVRIAGNIRSFCPFSQMAMPRETPPADLAGKVFPFRITEYSEGGRNIVLSRRALLDEARKTARQEIRERLSEGMRVKGKVVSLKDFGAFVDIGGIEGMIPVSEIAWGRTGKASDVLSTGQEVEVVIKKLDWEKDRISLSLKDALPDPWESIERTLPVGSFQNGTVARLMAFGAFVTLPNGMDGLIHISKLGTGGKRINHPKEVLKEGQAVEVRIEAIDRGNRKLSLSLAEISREEEEAAATLKEYKQRESADTRSMGTLGDLLKAKLEKKEEK